MASYQGKVVLITGASSGIGAALAREVAGRGATLVLLARRLERLQSLAAELSAGGCKVFPYVCDVTKDDDLRQVIGMVVKDTGRIDVVVANAGFGVVGNLVVPQHDARRVLNRQLQHRNHLPALGPMPHQ